MSGLGRDGPGPDAVRHTERTRTRVKTEIVKRQIGLGKPEKPFV